MLTPEDKDLLVKKGISEQQIAEQLACFEKGFPFLKLDAAASVEKGIMAPAENEMKNYLEAWDTYKVCTRLWCCQPHVQEFVRIPGG